MATKAAPPSPGDLVTAALGYAARGWPVFPCSPKDKTPLLGNDVDPATGAKIPKTGGVKKASTDPDTIRGWWKRWPKALIGLATGHGRLFVLDFDPRTDPETGEVFTLERLKGELEAQMGESLPASMASVTQSGGAHVWLTWPDDGGDSIRNRGNLPEHVDVRGLGGYVIAPPSIMATGNRYRMLREIDPVEAPAALVSILREPARKGRKAHGSSPPGGDAGRDRAAAYEPAALAALNAECDAIARAPSGGRQSQLNLSAFNVAQLVGAGALNESMARAAIEAAAAGNPGRDTEAQIQATIDSAWAAGLAKPRELPEPRHRAARRVAPHAPTANDNAADPDALNRQLCQFPMTDLGNAERFKARFGHQVHYVDRVGWGYFDGRRWIFNGAEAAIAGMVHATVRAIGDEARTMRKTGRRDKGEPGALDDLHETKRDGTEVLKSDRLLAWARASESASKLGCIAGIARGLAGSGITIQPEQLDANPMLINVANGTLELFHEPDAPEPWAEVRLRPHDPRDLITHMVPFDYRPAARCPRYDAALAKVQPEPDMRRFLHQWYGYSLTGDTSEQRLVFHHGSGSNGKSTLADAWAAVAGDYSATVGIETFLDQGRRRKGSDASPDLAALVGVRMLRTSEPEKGAKLAEALIKLATGGEPMSVRRLNRDPFDLIPRFKLSMAGNHRPSISGADDGIWRRVLLVPWDVQVSDREKDRGLTAKLREEGSGILNRLLDGLIDWRVNGLKPPPSVTGATADYREQSDPLGRFLRDCTREAAGERVRSSELHALFVAWARANGEREWTTVGFSKAMIDRGKRKIESHGIKWVDMAMTRLVSDFGEDAGAAPRPPWEDDDG